MTAAIIQGCVVWSGNSWTGWNMMLLYEVEQELLTCLPFILNSEVVLCVTRLCVMPSAICNWSENSIFQRIVQLHQVVFQTMQNCYRNAKDVLSCLWKGNNEQNSNTWLAFHIKKKKRRQHNDETRAVCTVWMQSHTCVHTVHAACALTPHNHSQHIQAYTRRGFIQSVSWWWA